jgi:hypothetical protein
MPDKDIEFPRHHPQKDLGPILLPCPFQTRIFSLKWDGRSARNKDHLHRPIAKLSYFQKGAYCAGIKIFNILPPSLKTISDKKEKFKVALKRYLNTHTFYYVHDFLHLNKVPDVNAAHCVRFTYSKNLRTLRKLGHYSL